MDASTPTDAASFVLTSCQYLEHVGHKHATSNSPTNGYAIISAFLIIIKMLVILTFFQCWEFINLKKWHKNPKYVSKLKLYRNKSIK